MRISRKRLVIIAVVIALAIVAGVFVGTRDQSERDSHKSWYYQVTAELVVDGRPVRIQRVIECRPIWRESEGGARPSYFSTRYLSSERLADGSGVMVVNPDLCVQNTPIEERYDPVVLWVDKADSPQIIEAYYDVDSLRHGDRRAKLISIDVVAPVDALPGDYSAEFMDWWGGTTRLPIPDGTHLEFSTAYAFEIHDSKWAKDARIKSALESLSASGPIDHKSDLGSLLDSAFPPPTDVAYRNGGYYPTAEHPSLDGLISNKSLRIDEVVPLRVEAEQLVADFSSIGTLIFYPRERLAPFVTDKGPTDVLFAGGSSTVRAIRGAGSFIWQLEGARLFFVADMHLKFVLDPRAE